MPKRDISKPTYYLDSCVLIDLIEFPDTQEPAKTVALLMADADEGRCNLITSVLTIAEVLFAKHEIENGSVDPTVEEKIENIWHPSGSPIQLIEVHELIVRDAANLLRENMPRGWRKVRGNDAIHLVSARRNFADEFFTHDKSIEKWADIMGFKVCAPHRCEPPAPPPPNEGLFRKELPSP